MGATLNGQQAVRKPADPKWISVTLSMIAMPAGVLYLVVRAESVGVQNMNSIRELKTQAVSKTEVLDKLELRDQKIESLQRGQTRIEGKVDKLDESVDGLKDDIKQLLYEIRRSSSPHP